MDSGGGMARKGMGGHQSARAATTTWLTPPEILSALGPFDLDPCAAPDPRPWPTAAKHYTWPRQDGLALPWRGRIFMNPPYGNALGAWLSRLAEHGTGTALVFARTDTEAFFSYVWERADAVLFLRGRTRFRLPDGGRATHNGGAPTVLAAYGPRDVERLMESGLDGQLVGLRRPVLVQLALRGADPEEASSPAWREVVLDVVGRLGGGASLAELYAALESHPKARANPHWREKVRQTVGRVGLRRVGPAQYALAA
jgi:hypothetical protein